jgi:tRNA threonylcarbamoyladenosine biosynthesis protein TsaB
MRAPGRLKAGEAYHGHADRMPARAVKPLILAADTTHEFGGLALTRGEEMLEEAPLHSPSGFAHVLFGHLSGLLERRGVRVEEIDCFAAASGPGSFTGVRVGLAFVKGLADALGKPAAAVSNLRAMASFGSTPLRATVLVARRGEIYCAVYDGAGRLVSPEVVMKLTAWIERLPEGELEFVSSDPALPGAALAGTRFEGARVVTAPRAMAGAVAKIALAAWDRGEVGDAAALDANYVRRSDAELFWKE